MRANSLVCLCNVPIYLLIPLALIRDSSDAVGHNIHIFTDD